MKNSFNNIEQIKNEKYKNILSSPQYIQMNKQIFIKQEGDNINNNFQQTKKINILKQNEYNLKNQKNIKITSTKNNNINELNKENKIMYEMGSASVHQIVSDISKQKTIIAEVQILKPIIKEVINIKNSVNNAITNQIINKEIIQENTLPISYLPTKVNELIYLNKINTLPIINAENKVTYKTDEPFIHELKVHDKDENNITNNINISHNVINNNIINNINNNPEKNMVHQNMINNTGKTNENDIEKNSYNISIKKNTNKNDINQRIQIKKIIDVDSPLNQGSGTVSQIQVKKIPVVKTRRIEY